MKKEPLWLAHDPAEWSCLCLRLILSTVTVLCLCVRVPMCAYVCVCSVLGEQVKQDALHPKERALFFPFLSCLPLSQQETSSLWLPGGVGRKAGEGPVARVLRTKCRPARKRRDPQALSLNPGLSLPIWAPPVWVGSAAAWTLDAMLLPERQGH